MRLLLDTHIWVWSLDDPSRLTDRVAGALRDAENEIWLSPISVWEVLLLVEKGRLGFDQEPGSWIRRAIDVSRSREASLNHQVAIQSRGLKLAHGDPADRFLAATAIVYELVLVTGDERLLEGNGWEVLPNTT